MIICYTQIYKGPASPFCPPDTLNLEKEKKEVSTAHQIHVYPGT